MSIGANIQKRRMELRMTQQELAGRMGYRTRSTIAKIESGENDVSHKKLQKFSEVLDTTVEKLVAGYVPVTKTNDTSAMLDAVKKNKNIVVILAGGKTGRNRQNIPSQFISVHNKPIIVYCMEVYQNHPAIDDIYIVCLKGWENIVNAYAKEYGITKLKGLIRGGNTGMDSLKNAHTCISELYSGEDFIIIQEATRPQVTAETVSGLLQECYEKGNATICHSMNEYVQFNVSGGKPRYVDRNSVIAMQSPEAHKLSLMNEVFSKAEKLGHPLTESCCTMLLYNLGYDINFIESGVNNIKISGEEDLAAFSVLVKK